LEQLHSIVVPGIHANWSGSYRIGPRIVYQGRGGRRRAVVDKISTPSAREPTSIAVIANAGRRIEEPPRLVGAAVTIVRGRQQLPLAGTRIKAPLVGGKLAHRGPVAITDPPHHRPRAENHRLRQRIVCRFPRHTTRRRYDTTAAQMQYAV